MRLYIAFAHVSSSGVWGFGYQIIDINPGVVNTDEHVQAVMFAVKAASPIPLEKLIILNMQPLPIVSPGE